MKHSPSISGRPRMIARRRLGLRLGIFLALAWLQIGWAIAVPEPSTIVSPAYVGGATGRNDQRDADVYPAIAYDPGTGRYLAVWMTVRNAGSSSDGFDVYGVFLDMVGRQIGKEFRISDNNTAARSGQPVVVAGNREFVVLWTTRGSPCKVSGQRVSDGSARPDWTLPIGTSPTHSPSLVYNDSRQRYVLAFIEGNDYLPPTLFGAATADCGNNPAGASRAKALEFHFDGTNPVIDAQTTISEAGGAFRPRLTYGAAMGQYLIAWEDRRDAGGQEYRFDLYAQRLNADLTPNGANIALATGSDFNTGDSSATWTPRPAVAASDSRFLVVWFDHITQSSGSIWSLRGRLVPGGDAPGAPFALAETTFAEQHQGNAPTGFLSAVYNTTAGEYLVGMTSHLESLWGYFSVALIQRVSPDGQLLDLDGTVLSETGVGNSIDYDNDDQLALALAPNPVSGPSATEYMMVYSKHPPGATSQDFDIWGARLYIPSTLIKNTYLAIIRR